ncbi:3'-5' exonuclease [Tessaracoccus lacteus]|uniref:3'-5' exonuclease n=1 Tax=Tessaracoccus lacteus TaxID=3041766 RepID=A0ABY8PY15_9ACTN|nr:3'-5' exonuclease [Tessaracoccus sp. T21]WGT47359.1 3'-5' exonuclease [Tessaracoccus sp. T21]
MPFDYTAIDLETANPFRGSPCSVGLVKVRGGVTVDERHWLMRPPAGHDEFSSWNVRVHGISAGSVARLPRWRDFLPRVVDFIDGDVLVAHNASFDASVLCQACEVDGLETPDLEYVCTRDMAKELWPLSDYKLPTVMKAVGKVMVGHHDALADARAVVAVVDGMRRQLQHVGSLRELAGALDVQVKELRRARLRVR